MNALMYLCLSSVCTFIHTASTPTYIPSSPPRWKGEPVKAILLPTTTFTSNKRGYPVLSKRHQELIATFFRLRVQVSISPSLLNQGIAYCFKGRTLQERVAYIRAPIWLA